MTRTSNRRVAAVLGAVLALALATGSAAAHSHVVNQGTPQEHVIANGQNHPAFAFDAASGLWISCVTNALLPGYGPAWYGLETAHHGPDSGGKGKGDGCYAADASPVGEADDVNPAID